MSLNSEKFRVGLRSLAPTARFQGARDIEFDSLSADSRETQPGDLFVALLGDECDGHDHAAEAIARGAKAVVVERLLPVSVPQCIVPDTRSLYSQASQALAGFPAHQLKLLGVTGSSGKTVVSLLLASILKASGNTAGLSTSLGCTDGLEIRPSHTANLPPREVADWCRRTSQAACGHGVLEVNSHALARHRTAGLQFDGAVLTNLSPQHPHAHGSFANYRNITQRLFEQLKPEGFAVLNADDAGAQSICDQLRVPALTYGLKQPAEVTGEIIERQLAEQTFLLTAGSDCIPVCTRMVGDHHVSNCLAAAAAGLVLGLDLPTIARGLEAIDFVPGRMERLECGQPFSVFVDGAQTPERLAVALASLRQSTRGRVYCVFGSPANTDRETRQRLGQTVERFAHRMVITSDDPGYEEPLQIAHEILDGFRDVTRAQVLPDRLAAIEWALAQAQAGDCVLIAGKGDCVGQTVGKKRFEFDDREAARAWLYRGESIAAKKTRPPLRIFAGSRHCA